MKEPQIGHLAMYQGPRFASWNYGVQWEPWAKLTPTGEIGRVERMRYMVAEPYRRRKVLWKKYYRGGTSC